MAGNKTKKGHVRRTNDEIYEIYLESKINAEVVKKTTLARTYGKDNRRENGKQNRKKTVGK